VGNLSKAAEETKVILREQRWHEWLSGMLKVPTISGSGAHERIDDADGVGSICITWREDDRIFLTTTPAKQEFPAGTAPLVSPVEFNVASGAGNSPDVSNALKLLSIAIAKDNEWYPLSPDA